MTTMRPFRRVSGFTLIEICVSLAVFALMIGMALEISRFSTRAAGEKITLSTLQTKGERTLKQVIDAIEPGTQLNLNTAATTTPYVKGPYANIEYQVPRDVDDTGNPLTKAPDGEIQGLEGAIDQRNLEYGLDDRVVDTDGLGNPIIAGVMLFRYEKIRELSEVDEDSDLNGDNIKADTFDVGRLRWEYYYSTDNMGTDEPRFFNTIGDPNIVQRTGNANWGQSILGDPLDAGDISGRIFSANGAILTVTFHLMTISTDRIAAMVVNKGQIFLRNQ